MRRKHKSRNDNELMRDVAAGVAEHFEDYVVIGRIKDGIVWRMSDRTFALGACQRAIDKIKQDDIVYKGDDE